MQDYSGLAISLLFIAALVALFYFSKAAGERIQPMDNDEKES